MTTNQNTIEVLNDLIRINNDRVTGYTKAIEELKDEDNDLRVVFQSFVLTSKRIISELTEAILNKGGEPAHDTTAAGKIYRAWMDVKATFTGHDTLSILSACEYGEDAAQKSYKIAIEDSIGIEVDSLQLITAQKAELKKEHDSVKEYRDAEKVAK
ncbi:MAG: hypothetical protein JWO58_681 [Chitinophagaceae bacterium]|nr:hypothetical protein [Chitinophagaceae bacterium]